MTVNVPIVDRLRACGRRYAGWDKTADIPKKWCIEAADEIDRLRAEVDRMKSDIRRLALSAHDD